MGSLYVERLLDFSVRREKEVDEDDAWDEEGEECICLLGQLDIAAIEVRGPFIDGCIPIRCRIAANAHSFAYHHEQTASYGGGRHRYARSSRVLASRPPLSALRGIAAFSPQRPNKYARASNQPPSRLTRPSSIEMMLFGLGNLFYGKPGHSPDELLPKLTVFAVSILLVNAVAVLSEDRFLARSKHSFGRGW